jgi:hypothetical protein
MNSPNPNPQTGRRIALSAGLAVVLLACGVFALFAFDSDSVNINIDIDDASWPWLIGWFLLADGLLSFFGGLLYIAIKIPRLQKDPQIAALQAQERANLSATENRAAEERIQALYARAWRLGLTFMAAGGVSLVFAILLLKGVIPF